MPNLCRVVVLHTEGYESSSSRLKKEVCMTFLVVKKRPGGSLSGSFVRMPLGKGLVLSK